METIKDIFHLKSKKEELQEQINKLEQTYKEKEITLKNNIKEIELTYNNKENSINTSIKRLEDEQKLLNDENNKLKTEQEYLNNTLDLIKIDIANKNHEQKRLFEIIKNYEYFFVENELKRIETMTGIEFERYCGKLLENLNFTNVKVTKPTGDEGADVLGEYNNIKYIFQCKRYSNNVGNDAVQEIYTAKGLYKSSKAVIITNNYFTKQAKSEALTLDVELWDNTILSQKIAEAYNFSIKNLSIINGKTNYNLLTALKIIEWIIKDKLKYIDNYGTLNYLNNSKNRYCDVDFYKAIELLQELKIIGNKEWKRISDTQQTYIYKVLI